jgi:AcrR family transcriptional regulator
MAARARDRNPRGSGARLRDEIIEAGIALIDNADDPAPLTLRGIARAAGIAAPSIYPHFADLPAVTDAVLERSFAELEARVTDAIDDAPDPVAALLAGCGAYVQFGWDHRARYQLMFAESGFAPNAVNTFTRIESALTECVRCGQSTSADPHQDTFLLWAALHGIATLQKPARREHRRLGPLDRPAAVSTLVHRLAGLDPPAANQTAPPRSAGAPAAVSGCPPNPEGRHGAG